MRAALIVLVAAIPLGLAPPAAAAEDADAAAWRPFTDEAVRLFEAGRFAEAAEQFQRARDVGAPPLVVYNLARCHEELERWEIARDTFRAYLALDDGNETARSRARTALAAIVARLATGWVVVQGAPVGATVVVDGEPVGETPLAQLALPPGAHEITVRLEGHAPWAETVTVAGGGRSVLEAALAPLPAPPPDPDAALAPDEPVAPPHTLPDAPPGAPAATPSRYTPWTWVTLGGGLGVAAAGTICYVLGEQDHADVTGAADYGTDGVVAMSRERALALEASGDRKKLAGAILWGVGGGLVATSAVLFVLDATTDAPTETIHVGVAPTAGGTFLSLSGWF